MMGPFLKKAFPTYPQGYARRGQRRLVKFPAAKGLAGIVGKGSDVLQAQSSQLRPFERSGSSHVSQSAAAGVTKTGSIEHLPHSHTVQAPTEEFVRI